MISFSTTGNVCLVCSSTNALRLNDVFDDRYGHPGEFTLMQCQGCGHVMTHPQLQEDDLPALYSNYYPRKHTDAASVAVQASGVKSRWAPLLRWWDGTDNQGQYAVKPGQNMLDIGCGSGASLLEAQHLGAKVWGVEADPNVQPLAAALGLKVHQGNVLDNPFPGVQFDLVVMNQVIEHIPQPDLVLAAIKARLAPGGRVVLVVPNVDSLWCRWTGAQWINWHIPYHLHHFNKATLTKLIVRCGYRITKTRTVTPNLWTLLQLRVNRTTAVRGTPSVIWAVKPAGEGVMGDAPRGRNGVKAAAKRIAIALVLVPVALFNRVVDAAGWGDSLVVELTPVESK